MTGIYVQTQFEGIHCYPEAPKGVEFLKNPHRHIFYVSIEMEVTHADRELEFILVKRDLDTYIERSSELGGKSCETIARDIQDYLKNRYPIDRTEFFERQVPLRHNRKVNVMVKEDNENGGFVREF